MSWGGWFSGGQAQNEWDPLQGPPEPAAGASRAPALSHVPVSPRAAVGPPMTPQRGPQTVGTPSASFQTPMRTVPEDHLEEFQHFSLLVDYKHLVQRLPTGLHVLPSVQDDVWDGIVFVKRGPYAGGVFKFAIKLAAYPMQAPEIVFQTRVFHPAIHPVTGRMDALLSEWRPQTERVWHVLKRVAEELEEPSEGSGNAEAASMQRERPETFAEFCRQCVRESVLAAEQEE